MTTVSHEEVEFFSETLLAQTSTIPNAGLGLFAKCDFKIGEEICDYIGTIRSLKEVNSSTFNTDYCLFLNLIRLCMILVLRLVIKCIAILLLNMWIFHG